MRNIKLYRGLKAEAFQPFTQAEAAQQRKTWAKLLEARAQGDFAHPVAFDAEIRKLESGLRLRRQYFTDRREVAAAYARSEGGSLLSIELPLDQVLSHFSLEFQNFSKRRSSFEIVYLVSGELLAKHAKAWKLKCQPMKRARAGEAAKRSGLRDRARR